MQESQGWLTTPGLCAVLGPAMGRESDALGGNHRTLSRFAPLASPPLLTHWYTAAGSTSETSTSRTGWEGGLQAARQRWD